MSAMIMNCRWDNVAPIKNVLQYFTSFWMSISFYLFSSKQLKNRKPSVSETS